VEYSIRGGEITVADQRGVAGYFRVSVARDDMKAPELYSDEITRYCGYRNLALKEIFSDIDYSGYNNSERRPALNELVCRRHEFSAVIVPKLSRFGRSLKHLTQLFETFDNDGIALVFLDLGMDTSTSQGRLLRNIMASFAEYESDVRADYTRANFRFVTQQGRPFGGLPPYGYLYDRKNRTYRPHPQQADVVRFIFRRYEEGVGQLRIARELTVREIPTAGGLRVWQPGRIGRLLDNPAYAALLRLDGKFVAAKWDPLVSPEQWQRVAERRKVTREKWSRKRAPKRLLAGLVYCEDCGRKAYYTARGGDLPGRYRCSRNDAIAVCVASGANAVRVEDYVTHAFLERARYYLLQGQGTSFIAQRQWDLADRDEKRMLLHAVIERVVIESISEGNGDPGRSGRGIRIEWKDKPATVERPPVNRHTKATGRAPALAREQLEEARAERAKLSERSRSYYREWAEHRRGLSG
jgi:DNA invertase Pin-like site-specific DNA recombinase